MTGRVRERLARHGDKAATHLGGRRALKPTVHVHVRDAALAGQPVELHTHVDGRVLQRVDTRAHGGERLAQAVRELAQLADGCSVVAMHHLEGLDLQHQTGELVSH